MRLTVPLDVTHAHRFAAAVWLGLAEAQALPIVTDRPPCVVALAVRQGPARSPGDGR